MQVSQGMVILMVDISKESDVRHNSNGIGLFHILIFMENFSQLIAITNCLTSGFRNCPQLIGMAQKLKFSV